MIEVQIVVPPERGLSKAYVSLSRTEATNLRDALDLMLITGSSGWRASISWGDLDTEVALRLEMDAPTDPTVLPGGTANS